MHVLKLTLTGTLVAELHYACPLSYVSVHIRLALHKCFTGRIE